MSLFEFNNCAKRERYAINMRGDVKGAPLSGKFFLTLQREYKVVYRDTERKYQYKSKRENGA